MTKLKLQKDKVKNKKLTNFQPNSWENCHVKAKIPKQKEKKAKGKQKKRSIHEEREPQEK